MANNFSDTFFSTLYVCQARRSGEFSCRWPLLKVSWLVLVAAVVVLGVLWSRLLKPQIMRLYDCDSRSCLST